MARLSLVLAIPDDLIRALQAAPLSVKKRPMVQAMREVMRLAVRYARKFAPVDTGRLKSSIGYYVRLPTRRTRYVRGTFVAGKKGQPILSKHSGQPYGYIIEWQYEGKFSWGRRALSDDGVGARRIQAIFAKHIDRWSLGD